MPLTVWLNRKLTRYLENEDLSRIYNDLIFNVGETFGFDPETMEAWERSTVRSLGGIMTESIDWITLGEETTFSDFLARAFATGKVVVIRGTSGNNEARIEIYGRNSLRNVYSDFIFEMENGLYDELKKSETSPILMSTLKDLLDRVQIDFKRTIMGKAVNSKRRVVNRAYISDNIPDVSGRLTESSLLFIYQPSGNDTTLVSYVLRYLMNNLKNRNQAGTFELFDQEKIAKAITKISSKKGYLPSKYANVRTGSIAYIAKPHEDLDHMFEDFRVNIAEPIINKVNSSLEIYRVMEESVREAGPGSLDGFVKKEN